MKPEPTAEALCAALAGTLNQAVADSPVTILPGDYPRSFHIVLPSGKQFIVSVMESCVRLPVEMLR